MSTIGAVSTKDLFQKLNLPYPPAAAQTRSIAAKTAVAVTAAVSGTVAVAGTASAATASTAGTMTPVGGRNTMLTSLGGFLRRKGLQRNAIEQILQIANVELCSPPLSPIEVAAVATSVSTYSATPSISAYRQSLNDVGNADRLITTFMQDIRYLREAKGWLIWARDRWSFDQHAVHITTMAKAVARNLYNDVPIYAIHSQDLADEILKHAKKTHELPRLEAMMKLAARDPAVSLSAVLLNHNKMLLGVDNGVLDLRSGKLRPYRREDLITHVAPVTYDPAAKCPEFLRFVNRITAAFDSLPRRLRQAAHREFCGYLQRVIGYCLTGSADEQVLFFFFGHGANGKSTLLRVIQDVMGHDLAKQTQPETLMEVPQAGSSASGDMARLVGARLVTSNETEDGKALSESRIKQLTGGDPVTCRFLYQEFFEFFPEFKLIISGNHKPVIKGTDDGIWRRLHLVPFLVTIPEGERDSNLGQKLRAELPGILNWALAGCLQWQKHGLKPPQLVRAAVNEYREDSDLLGQWISEELVVEPQGVVSAMVLFSNYSGWAERNNLRPMSAAALGRRLKERGYGKGRTSRSVEYHGLRINNPPVRGLTVVSSRNFGTPGVSQTAARVVARA
jgi:putative DNA primase/helicase